jgi:RNA polymerase sigma-70 factor (ECF subfamily)
MSDAAAFDEFIRRIRAGDADAARELVRQYEPAVRLEIRVRLRDPRLRRSFDSLDVCQSVMASFFVRVAAGQYEFQEPRDLVRLLVVMARKKLAFHTRKERALRRDNRRLEAAPTPIIEQARVGNSPSEQVAANELLAALRQRLNDEERQIADRRGRGESWADIARALGGTAEARRKQFDRAVDRVSRQLGLEDRDDG